MTKLPNTAKLAGEMIEQERKQGERIESVQDAVLYTANALRDLNYKMDAMEEVQQKEREENKKRDERIENNEKKNLFASRTAAWAAIITIILTIVGFFIK